MHEDNNSAVICLTNAYYISTLYNYYLSDLNKTVLLKNLKRLEMCKVNMIYIYKKKKNLLSESSLLSGLGNIANFASNEDDPYITMKNVRTINMQRI